MDPSSIKLRTLHIRRPEYDYEGETLREKESLLIAAQNNAIRTNKLKSTRLNKIANVGYVVKETKQSIA